MSDSPGPFLLLAIGYSLLAVVSIFDLITPDASDVVESCKNHGLYISDAYRIKCEIEWNKDNE